MTDRVDTSWAQIKAAAPKSNEITNTLMQTYPLEQRSVPAFLQCQALKHGAKTLFSCAETSFSYADAPEIASRRGAELTKLGVQKGDRVVLFAGNCPQFMEVFLGCAWIGAIAVPINTASRGQQLQHILSNCGAKIAFVESEILHAFETLDLQMVPLADIFLIGSQPQTRLAGINLYPFPVAQGTIDPADLGPDDPLAILYTSGTTGMSKGVLCPHGQFFWWAVMTATQLGINDKDVLHTTLPLFHVNALGCFFQALLYGASQVVSRRFSASRFWEELVQSQATVTYLLGAMVPILLSREETAAENSHKVRVALAPGVPDNFHDPFMERSGVVLFDGYGSTETNAVIGCDHTNYRNGTMGKLKDGIEALVVDALDQPVPDGLPGELLLRSTQPFCFASGYFGMPDKTVEAWRNLWFHTGDTVVKSKDGYFNFIDRAKDCIRRRGENISSFEVEQVLASHPKIALAAVFAVQSELGEDEVMTSIVPEQGQVLEEEEIIRFCEGQMTYFSIPRFIDIVSELPRTESGKIQKFKLREQGKTASTWDREAAGVVVRR